MEASARITSAPDGAQAQLVWVTMRAFFFGPSERPLFGALHPVEEGAGQEQRALVLAYPWLAEYNMSHWAFRKLASMLAQVGFSVLRFDYSGTGDSSGRTSEARTSQWVTDIVTAAHEVTEQTGARSVSIVGFGLGASLALEASREHPFEDIVLWDPVINGHEYLAELDALDGRQRTQRLYPPLAASARSEQLLGHPFSQAARADLRRVDSLRCQPQFTGRALIVASEARASYRALLAKLATVSPHSSLQVLPRSAEVPVQPAAGHTAMMAMPPLNAISAFLRGTGQR